MAPAKVATALLAAASLAWALAGAAPAEAQGSSAPSVHKARSGKPPAGPSASPQSARKPTHPKSADKPSRHHRTKAKAPSGVLALAGCYGHFIAWRDELSTLMLQANSYTPWPDDRIRFDRMERAFAAGVQRDRKLALTLQPTFREDDFPPDVRTAFRAGLKTASAAFAADGYKHTQIMVIGQPDLSPRQRMAQLEANADQVFAPLAAPCERLAGG